ncbi:MAG TPA: hypothetical protein VK009_29730 [Chloroflexota bacterium]|nr:hypothetical protein [Chloroflexota bacterium]
MDTRHPFQAGGLVSAEYFWDREDERRRVKQVYESGTIAVLSGARRMGKSSLAEIVGREMADAGELHWTSLSIRETTPANFPEKLMATAFHLREGHHVANLMDRALAFARTIRLQPVVEGDPLTGGLSFKFNARRAAAQADDADLYHDILQALEKDAQEGGRKVALVLDEFQDITKSAPMFPEVLKSRGRSGGKLAILLMGSSQHLMSELFSSPSAPLYRIGLQIAIGPLPLPVVRDEVQRRFGWNGITISNEVVDTLYEASAGVPQDIQMICLAALEEARRHRWREITSERLEAALRDLVEQNIDRFVEKWNQLTPVQRDVAVAIAQYGGKKTLSRDFISRIDPARPPLPATVRRSLLSMIEKEILEPDRPEGYRFKDALFAYYLRRLVADTSVRPD